MSTDKLKAVLFFIIQKVIKFSTIETKFFHFHTSIGLPSVTGKIRQTFNYF